MSTPFATYCNSGARLWQGMPRVSEYPAGTAGIGLLSLRGAAVIMLANIALHNVHATTPAAAAGLSATAFMIGIGLYTRSFALASALFSLMLANICGAAAAAVAGQALATTALLLLGPGAFSADARLFGRRVISRGEREARGNRR